MTGVIEPDVPTGIRTGICTTVHLLRHGEVHNPEKVLYGRLPGYRLSERGEAQAKTVAAALADDNITVLLASPLQRAPARPAAPPIAQVHRLEILTEPNLIEADNVFEGKRMGVGDGVLRHPEYWSKLRNPFKPSWGEPCTCRSRPGCAPQWPAPVRWPPGTLASLCVSHQLPIWTTRRNFECKADVARPPAASVRVGLADHADLRRRRAGRAALPGTGRCQRPHGDRRMRTRALALVPALALVLALVLAAFFGLAEAVPPAATRLPRAASTSSSPRTGSR